MNAMRGMFAFFVCGVFCAFAVAADAGAAFDAEEIKPYIKIIDGPWVGNSVSGRSGAYTIHVQVPRGARYALGLFDNKINRAGADARSAVVLVDGVNPLAPAEQLDPRALDSGNAGSAVASFRKYPLDGLSYTAQDASGKNAFVKVVDAKEEWEVGAVKPLAVPAGRTGALGRIDVFVFAASSQPPVAGQAVIYGASFLRYTMLLREAL